MPTFSVVIPSWNGLDHLKRNLPSVIALGANEVILVDDASSDGTLEFVKSKFPQIKIVSHKLNQRFPKTANDGIRVATGDIAILLNQDLRPNTHLISSIRPYFTNPQVFAVTFNEQGRSWANAEFKAGFLEFSNGLLDKKPHLSFWASGGSAAFRKSIWDKLGGFDPIFSPGYYEDLDIGYRAYKRGYHIIWDPQALVEHDAESAFNTAFSPHKLSSIKERNYLIAVWKNLDISNVLRHKIAIFKRILSTPGYLKPTMAAVCFLPHIIAFRLRERTQLKVTDAAVFNLIAHGQ